MVSAVKPPPIRAMPKKQMINEPAVSTMSGGIDDILTIRHKKHMIMRPTKIDARSRPRLKLVQFSADLFVGDREHRETLKSGAFPLGASMRGLKFCYPPPRRRRSQRRTTI